MIVISTLLILFYSLLLVGFCLVWWLNPENEHQPIISNKEAFSVIIVVRNEAKNMASLLESLVNQIDAIFEVILVDDSSEDATVEIAKAYLGLLDLKLIHLQAEERGYSPKKNAITKAINAAKYDLIFCTDGDCILPSKLLSNYAKEFNNQHVKFISGPVTFKENNSGFGRGFWNKIQVVEFASLVGSAAVSIFLNKPNMCSGANLAYRKSAFFEVNGYEGNHTLASGDDEFLMHKIHQKYLHGVSFVKNRNCIVQTDDCESLGAFYQQRKRWASKWTYYESLFPKLLAIFVFMVNLSIIYLIINGLWTLIGFRFFAEFIFLSSVLMFLDKQRTLFFIPLVQLIYPLYVVFFGLNSLFMKKTYQWKGRKLK